MAKIGIGYYAFGRLPEIAFAFTWQFFLAIPTTLLIVIWAFDII